MQIQYLSLFLLIFLQAAAKYLQSEAEKWEDDCNPIVKVAKEMSVHLNNMADYTKGEGQIQVSDGGL